MENLNPTTVTPDTTPQVSSPARQSRWKSPVLWSSIVAQVLALLQLTGALKAIGVDAGTAGNIVAMILQLLVAVGILNSPTDPVHF